MPRTWIIRIAVGGFFLLTLHFSLAGCTTIKKMVGITPPEDEEETYPPEAAQETVVVDGKTYVRSRNPYYLTYPEQPEYIYAEKGKEFVGLQASLAKTVAKYLAKEREKTQKGVPPDKLKDLVRQEVDRILREEGVGAFMARGGEKVPFPGRAVAVIPNPDSPKGYDGLNRMLAMSVAETLGRQKDMKVAGEDQIKAALGKAGLHGKLSLRPNLQALGDFLGVQAVLLTNVVPPEKEVGGFLVVEVYDTFHGSKADAIVSPAGRDGLKPEAASKFARDHALRLAGALLNVDWFGRVDFVKEGNLYLNLGQNAGLKVGDRLKVVEPGKEVINPQTHASLGFSADVPKGEIKVTELLSQTGAVAQTLSGGPFKSGDKVKAR